MKIRKFNNFKKINESNEDEISNKSNIDQGTDSIDTMLIELSDKLGAKKTKNVIDYNGMTIEFYSDPMCFAIDRKVDFIVNGKKTKLKTVDDVVNYLDNEDVVSSE